MGEALGNSCDNFSTHDGVASAVSIAASLITEPPGRFSLQEKPKQRLPGSIKPNRPLQIQKPVHRHQQSQMQQSRRDAGATKVKGAQLKLAARKAMQRNGVMQNQR